MRYVAVMGDAKLNLKETLEFLLKNEKILKYIFSGKKLRISNLNNFLKKNKIDLIILNLTGKQLKYHLKNKIFDFP